MHLPSISHLTSRAHQRPLSRAVSAGLATAAALFASAVLVAAATAPSLGSASSFAILAGTTVTNTGPTTITGDLGVSPGSAITGLGSITLTGSTHTADAVALQAQSDTTSAYNILASTPCTQSFSGTAVEIGGQTLTAGVYCYSSSVQLTGTLTLNGGGVFVFIAPSTLTTAASSRVALTGGTSPCDVFWVVESSATLGTNTAFNGTILALTSISLQTGASVSGRALAQHGAVTMDTNTVSNAGCAAATVATATPAATATPTATATATATPLATVAPTTVAMTPPPTSTDGAPLQGGSSSWLLVLAAAVFGSMALLVATRTYRGRAR